MGSFKYLLQFRPYLPWVFSSLAIGYVTYLQWNLRRLKAESKKQPMNKTDLERRHEVNIDTIDRTEDNGLTCCSDGTHSDDCCCSGEGINESVSQLPRCRRTAFSFFVNDSSKKSQLTDTEHSQNDKFVFINFAKECAHKWKELSSEEKAFYHKLSKEDGYRYERELQEYKQLAESQTKRSESTCKLEVNVHFEQPGPPVNQTKTVIHATTLLADSIPSKETHESSDQLIGEARLASHVPTTECVLLSIESPNDSLSNGPANSMGSSKRKVSLETASESDSTRIDHTDESIEKRSNEIEVFESILPETDVQNESIEPCDESIKAVTGVARIETYDEFPTSILTSRVAQSGNSKKK